MASKQDFCEFCGAHYDCGCYERIEAEIAQAEAEQSRRMRSVHEFIHEPD